MGVRANETRSRQQGDETMNATIHYVTEMVEVATGKVIERKLWTVKGSKTAAELLKSAVPTDKSYRGGEFRCVVTKAWAT
jgi:folate-dependent phosphoribosylglycinamide formyltransferase PurN